MLKTQQYAFYIYFCFFSRDPFYYYSLRPVLPGALVFAHVPMQFRAQALWTKLPWLHGHTCIQFALLFDSVAQSIDEADSLAASHVLHAPHPAASWARGGMAKSIIDRHAYRCGLRTGVTLAFRSKKSKTPRIEGLGCSTNAPGKGGRR